MDEILRKAELFINDCLGYDVPRIRAEVLPDDVNAEMNVAYMECHNRFHLLDVYYTADKAASSDEAYFLIHGGAFVYGDKINDRNFGMRLAKKSGIPVVNVNYTLMPDADLMQQLEELDTAIAFAEQQYGYKQFHFVGDSAGAYLAMMCALRHSNTLSVSFICGLFAVKEDDFPGALFEKNENGEKTLPQWYYILYIRANDLKGMNVAVITGENDFLKSQNMKMAELLGDSCVFYCAPNNEEHTMEHVFPITAPDWPEGVRTIEIISSFARKSC